MPVFLKIDPNGGTQNLSAVVPDASLTQDGVMTKLQAQQLANLVAGGGGGTGVGEWIITPVQVGPVTFDASVNDFVLIDDSTDVVTIVLPSAVGIKGAQIGVKEVTNFGGNNCEILTVDGQTIDGASSITLGFINQSQDLSAAIFVSDGANWFVGYTFRGYSGGGFVVSDTNHTLSLTDFVIAFATLTAPRMISGPPSGSPTAPRLLYVKDESGNASGINTITFSPFSGTIDGLASKVIINSAYGAARLFTNGTNWYTF
jgi:hypothetical protein